MKNKLLIALTLTAGFSTFAQADQVGVSHIVKDDSGVYYKYEHVRQGNGVPTVNYSCFIDFPNNPHTNRTHGWLSLGYKSGSIGLTSSMIKGCLTYIKFNTPKN